MLANSRQSLMTARRSFFYINARLARRDDHSTPHIMLYELIGVVRIEHFFLLQLTD